MIVLAKYNNNRKLLYLLFNLIKNNLSIQINIVKINKIKCGLNTVFF